MGTQGYQPVDQAAASRSGTTAGRPLVTQSYQSADKVTATRSGTQGVRSFVSQVTENTRIAVARQRPWRQLLDRGAFGRPASFADALHQMKKNLSYFRTNYAIFVLVVVGLSLLWHPIALIVLAVLVAAWLYLYFCRSEPLTVCGTILGDKLVLVVLSVVSIVALFLTGGGTALIIGLVVGVVVIAFHAAFRRTDDLFLDEQENAASGQSSIRTVQSGRV